VHAPRAGVDATLSFVGGPGFWFGDIAALMDSRAAWELSPEPIADCCGRLERKSFD